MSTRQTNTYILFTKRGRGIAKIIGPVFEHEIPFVKNHKFGGARRVHVSEETAFASQHFDSYHDHIQQHWLDKVYCYLAINSSWIGAVNCSTEERCFCGQWFGIFEMEDEDGEMYLQLNISVDANQFYVAKLTLDLEEMNICDILRGDDYYEDAQGIVHTDDPLTLKLATDHILNMCLN
jgi:hypothetical protein